MDGLVGERSSAAYPENGRTQLALASPWPDRQDRQAHSSEYKQAAVRHTSSIISDEDSLHRSNL
jgi:hypothetical protein